MDILMHPAAKWDPDSLNLDIEKTKQPCAEPVPQFLQPAHQPQLRLPSISSSWLAMPQFDQLPSQMTFSSYDDQSPMMSSPAFDLAPPQLLHPSSNFWTGQDTHIMRPTSYGDVQIPPAIHTVFRNPWQNVNDTDIWPNDSLSCPPDHTFIGTCHEPQGQLGVSQEGCVQPPMLFAQDAEQHQEADSLSQHPVSPVPLPQLTYHLPPSSNNGSALPKSSSHGDCSDSIQAPPTPMSQSPRGVHHLHNGEDPVPEKHKPRNGSIVEPFIHALCGKGFATLSGVKKHHWGKKVNDPATTTGCWAKHNKPDVAWNDHPSCKDRPSVCEATRSTPRPAGLEASIAQDKDTTTTSDSLYLNTISGFPTLEDLPRTVAKTLSTGNISGSGPEERQPHYHTHQLPSRSSFDNLLTAVNLVSRIDAPRPAVRIDSVARNLDAKIAAAEQDAPFVPFVPPVNTVGLGCVRPIAPIAPNVEFPGSEIGTKRCPPTDIEDFKAIPLSSRPFKHLASRTPRTTGPANKRREL